MSKKNAHKARSIVVCSEVVQIPLLPDMVDELLSLKIDISQLEAAFDQCLIQGYSLTIQYDPVDEKFSARLAGITEGLPNAGKLLYGNGDTRHNALLALYGKHFLASEGGLWVSTTGRSSKLS